MTAPQIDTQHRTHPCDCGASLEQSGITLEGRTLWHPIRCADCQDRAEARATSRFREKDTDAEIRRIAKAVAALDVPALYADATLESFRFHGAPDNRTQQGRVMQLVRRYLAEWPSVTGLLVFRGPPGTGKGHVVWSLARVIAGMHGATVTVVKCADLVRSIRASWRDPEATAEEQVIARYRHVDFLVVDEISRHAFYGQQIHQHLYDVLDYRIERRRPTIVTTNEDDAGLSDILRPALVDRLEGEGGVLEFGTESWRVRPREVA